MARSSLRTTGTLVAGIAAISGISYWTKNPPTFKKEITTISQKGRKFSISALDVSPGNTIRIINDDEDLQHHAYIESKEFKFDSGDQEPGSTTDITFPIPGTFIVLCGIHPKMKLVVNVK